MEEIPIIWTKTTKKQLEQIYLYIAEVSSIAQADNVFEKLVNSTSKLREQPQKNHLTNTKLIMMAVTELMKFTISEFHIKLQKKPFILSEFEAHAKIQKDIDL